MPLSVLERTTGPDAEAMHEAKAELPRAVPKRTTGPAAEAEDEAKSEIPLPE